MTKADLIEEVSRLAELTRKDSEIIVETIFDSVVRSLRSGDKIEIRGFGSFRTRQRKPRVGRNPKTGARGTITPIASAYSQDGLTCRDFLASYVRNGAESWMQGEACRAVHGRWSGWRRDHGDRSADDVHGFR